MEKETKEKVNQNIFDIQAESNTLNRLLCAVLEGAEAKVVEVEASFTKGLPGFSVVGLASSDIQESKERVKSALLNNGFKFPPLKITINLSPSDLKKSGTHLDLSIALLIALSKESIIKDDIFVFGELGLDGKIKSSSFLFPIILSLKEQGKISKAIVPKDAIEFLEHIPDVEFIPVEKLSEAIEALMNPNHKKSARIYDYDSTVIEINGKRYHYKQEYLEDFADIKGQEVAKRAALISAAGMHNFFMEGSPGCGKSMIAKRLVYILPPMSEKEILSVAKHKFLDAQKPNFKPIRPFRSPHHTATTASIFGGGSGVAKIGEVALAHCGILFFDELPHFNKNILEALREPMQDRRVNIARVNSKISYDADFMFVSAMNPCPCGNMLSKKRVCRCTEAEIKRYRNRLSDPFLDRMDIFVVMQDVKVEDKKGEDSASMHKKVIDAFIFRHNRGQNIPNGKIKESDIDKFITLSNEAQNILDSAIEKFALSHRSIVSIKKVARTIADLDSSQNIQKKHILEALSYRRRK